MLHRSAEQGDSIYLQNQLRAEFSTEGGAVETNGKADPEKLQILKLLDSVKSISTRLYISKMKPNGHTEHRG